MPSWGPGSAGDPVTKWAIGATPREDDPVTKWAIRALVREIDELYDDPNWMTVDELRELHTILEMAAERLGVSFDDIVAAETTAYERKRMAEMLNP